MCNICNAHVLFSTKKLSWFLEQTRSALLLLFFLIRKIQIDNELNSPTQYRIHIISCPTQCHITRILKNILMNIYNHF